MNMKSISISDAERIIKKYYFGKNGSKEFEIIGVEFNHDENEFEVSFVKIQRLNPKVKVGKTKGGKRTINELLSEIVKKFPGEKTAITSLKNLLKVYFSKKDLIKKRDKEDGDKLFLERLDKFIQETDASVLSEIKKSDFMLEQRVGEKTWKMLQKVVDYYS
jgi:hypothetical protein